MRRLRVAAHVMNVSPVLPIIRRLPVEKTRLHPILIDPEALACYRAALGIGRTGDALPAFRARLARARSGGTCLTPAW